MFLCNVHPILSELTFEMMTILFDFFSSLFLNQVCCHFSSSKFYNLNLKGTFICNQGLNVFVGNMHPILSELSR